MACHSVGHGTVADYGHPKRKDGLSMGKLRSGVLITALILSGCGNNAPVVTYPNGSAPQYQQPQAQQQPQYQAPQQQQPQAQPQAQQSAISQQQPPVQAARTEAGAFSARFVDRKTGAPIAGLQVEIGGETVTTDANGKAVFANVAPGAKYKTYHNDYVQKNELVPGGNGVIDIQLIPMSEYV